ncbi:serine hydrolase [Myxacorys almedinensis]|uniref:Serine hydrolase n=1 Tax=Myxacorys almedinensis A TaxID=2690445 RepID=A0A8J7YYN0_9CYAN|nr:serine hydrolase [Myxacorys almedinensis]NDJ16964.1 serine hydrolase [Myxacorys almedinensis A]
MKWNAIATSVALGLTLPFVSLAPSLANTIDDPDNVGWASIRGATSSAFSTDFNQKKADGYRVIDLEVDSINGQPRYSAVWQYNTDKRGWISLRDLSDEEFSQRWKEHQAKGYRLIDQEAYTINGKRYYAGVWMENKEKLGWVSYRNVDSAEFATRFKTYSDQGYRMTAVDAYPSGNQTQYAAIWVKNTDSVPWMAYRDLSESGYKEKFESLSQQGYRVSNLEVYQQNGQQRFAAIWVKNTNGRGWAARRDMDATWFGNWWKTYGDEGYRLVDFEAYPTSKGTRYAGVWRQNGDRLAWSAKSDVDKAIAAYKDQNNLPGISVAIAQNGKILYSRGFGFADVDKQQVAHAETIYRLASVSKPVTASLTMRLVDRDRLSLDQLTRSYLSDLPAPHTYRVQHLLNHQSGICHYEQCGSAWANQDYATAAAAMQKFINQPLLFKPGEKYDYSTHAYTVLGAVLEDVTKTSFASLVRKEITQGLGLPTLRPEDRTQPDSDRTTLYKLSNGKNVVSSPDKISWKEGGGGLESTSVDLTRLGIKLLNGSVMSPRSRDLMWTKSKFNNGSTSNYGLGWNIGTDQGRKIVAHDGSQNGARSYWRLYPEDGITIVVLTNRSEHNPAVLGQTLGSLALKASKP